MIIEQALITYLLADAGLSLLIGDRLHDDVLPQSPTLPAVVWQRISTPRFHSHSGPSGLAFPRFQFACWSTTRLEAIRTANALRACMDGFSGIISGVDVGAVFAEDEIDSYDPETGLRRVLLDLKIYHKE